MCDLFETRLEQSENLRNDLKMFLNYFDKPDRFFSVDESTFLNAVIG